MSIDEAKERDIKKESQQASPSKRFVRRLALFLIILILVWLLFDRLTPVALSILDFFDSGIFLIAFALIAIIWLIGRKKFSPLLGRLVVRLKTWAFWTGICILALALWGALALFGPDKGLFGEHGLGGRFGLRIIGEKNFLGFLRLLFLILFGLISIQPGRSWHITRSILKKCWQLYKTHPVHISIYRLFKKKPGRFSPPRENKGTYAGPVEEKILRYNRLKHELDKLAADIKLADTAEKRQHYSQLQQELDKLGKDIDAAVAVSKPAAGAISTSRSQSARVELPVNGKGAPAGAKEPKGELREATRQLWKKLSESKATIDASGWQLPSISILDSNPELEFKQVDNEKRARLIEEALASYGVDAKVVQINQGPAVTQFGVEPGWDIKYKEIKEKDKNGNIKVRQEEVSRTRVKVERITTLGNNLALALAATSIRIEAPVPGKSVVGVEVPNTSAGLVSLRGVLESASFQKVKSKSKLALALGKGAGGEAVAGELDKMPHLLIAGATGSGKTVCLNAIITCLLMNNTPEELKFIMLDPKRVEMTAYSSIPHLIVPVIVETERSMEILHWLSSEMDNRYKKLAAAGARNIAAYNKERSRNNPFPYIVLVIDELADLMITQGVEVEHALCRLAQLARATGIHLVVATQRPSVDVVTGLIKANFPTRISFAVASQVDSRTILDCVGAEKLLGKGDMLYLPVDAPKPKRLQGCYVSDPEIESLVRFWVSQRRNIPSPELDILTQSITSSAKEARGPEDPLLDEARKISREHPSISPSFLQRKLRIGLPRAAKLMEILEKESEETKLEAPTLSQEKASEQSLSKPQIT